MAASCPNRTRKKRLGRGGGTPACRGRLEVVLMVGVVLPLKSWGKRGHPSFETAVSARVARYGLKVPPEQLRAAYDNQSTRDIACSTCGWSLKRLLANVKAGKKRGLR